MEERPQLKLKLTFFDWVLELAGWASLIAIWVLTTTHYSSLPQKIAIHFDASGKANGFGSRGSILALPILSTFTFIGLTILNNYPQIFNFPTTITQDNALKQYTLATRIIRYVKFIIVVIFGTIVRQTIQNATNQNTGLSPWFLPLTMGLTLIPLAYYIVKSLQSKS
jgi:uncharacterized membrane protein